MSMNIKNQKAKRCIKKVPKVKKKRDKFKMGIGPRMELGVQNTTVVYPWFGT